VEASDPVTARLGREHNDANVLAMGARIVGSEVALACVAGFMTGEYQGGRHAQRVAKIARLEAAERDEPA
jgi:ribose 5-phosphate isomerase B